MIRKTFLALGAAAALFIPCTSFAQSAAVTGNAAVAGQLNVTNTTNSTSPTTGAIIDSGGLGVSGNLNIGGNFSAPAPNESPNTVYAGPSSGSPAAPSFRPLAQADLPNVTPSGGNTASPAPTILGRVITPIDFGAKGDGTTNDTTAVQNAIDAAAAAGGGGTLYLGQYQYCVNALTISSPVRIIGAGTNGQGVPTTGLRACSVNLSPMIDITATGATLENFGINMATPSGAYSTSGEALEVQGYQDVVSHVEITDPCIGILEAGNTNQYEYDQIAGFNSNVNVSACGGIQLGTSATASIDATVFATTIPMPSANSAGSSAYGWGINLVNAGGAAISANNILYTQSGTLIDPGPGESVTWAMLSNTVLGDSTYYNSLTIQPLSGGTVTGIFCQGCWSGNAGNWKALGTLYPAAGVWVHNDNGGTVSGVRFVNLKQQGSYGDGLSIGANVIGVQIIGSEFCGEGETAANTYSGISLFGYNILVSGNYIASTCFGSDGRSLKYGVLANSGGNLVTLGNWIGADDNGAKNVGTGIYINSGYGAFCELGNYINASTANVTNASSSTNTCY